MKKRWIALLCVLGLLLALTACGEDTPEEAVIPAGAQDDAAADVQEPAETAEPAAQGELPQWAVYWYLCGSDLESNGGFATADLGELTEVALPADVQVVIETGGSSTWHNDVMDAEKLQRWVYNSDGFYLVDEQPSASMPFHCPQSSPNRASSPGPSKSSIVTKPHGFPVFVNFSVTLVMMPPIVSSDFCASASLSSSSEHLVLQMFLITTSYSSRGCAERYIPTRSRSRLSLSMLLQGSASGICGVVISTASIPPKSEFCASFCSVW